ncbi:MAG: PD40 domain-containing protein [Anaerolineae bacterium]|nr:PD40 domain-containing protein [Anaerolineae bacterium]
MAGVPTLRFRQQRTRQNNGYPLITGDGTLVYRACDNSSTPAVCGIYGADLSASLDSEADVSAVQIDEDSMAILSDAHAQRIAFTSQRDGNWEAYLMNSNGTGLKNLSNSATSNDGLPTFSPDGKWVVFISDRSGEWAVWGVAVDGDTPQKVFNLPKWTPWGTGKQAWITERISWGP